MLDLNEEQKSIVVYEFRKAIKAMEEVWACLARIGHHLPDCLESELVDTIEVLLAGGADPATLTDDQLLHEIDLMVGDVVDEEDNDVDA